jgi:hypothetical protein
LAAAAATVPAPGAALSVAVLFVVGVVSVAGAVSGAGIVVSGEGCVAGALGPGWTSCAKATVDVSARAAAIAGSALVRA